MKRAISSILIAMMLIISLNTTVFAADLSGSNEQAYALNSFTGQKLDNIVDLKFTDNQIRFEYSGRDFSFPLYKLNIDTSDGKNISGGNFYSGTLNDLVCNVVEYDGAYCIQVFDKSKSIEGRKADAVNNFTIVAGDNMRAKIGEISSKIASVNEKKQSAQRVVNGQLHVYVSGVTVPFLLSGGSAEGWCTATIRESNNYQISSMQYVIAYNWPSDGISLWYDYINSRSAYQSPAWPSSALTNVSGTWTINGGTGAFVAEATISALVKGAPLMWTLYDVSYMNGTHQ